MLELRPHCENCRAELPPDSRDARICSFECTFCASCVEDVLLDVCPNCGGGFCRRPIRPRRDWKGGNSLDAHPPTETGPHAPVDAAEHARFAAGIRRLKPEER